MNEDTLSRGGRTGMLADLPAHEPSPSIDAAILQAARSHAAASLKSAASASANARSKPGWWRWGWRHGMRWPLAPLAGVTVGALLAVHLIFTTAPHPGTTTPRSEAAPAVAAANDAVSMNAEPRPVESALPPARTPEVAPSPVPTTAAATATAPAAAPAAAAAAAPATAPAAAAASTNPPNEALAAMASSEAQSQVRSRAALAGAPAVSAQRVPQDPSACAERLKKLLEEPTAVPGARERIQALIADCRTRDPQWVPPETLRETLREALGTP